MIETIKNRPKEVPGPVGERLTRKRLPPMNIARWTSRRKAQVVAAVVGGLLTADEACSRYCLTCEELEGWQKAFDRGGMPGLRATRR